jgi:hypothetical protein
MKPMKYHQFIFTHRCNCGKHEHFFNDMNLCFFVVMASAVMLQTLMQPQGGVPPALLCAALCLDCCCLRMSCKQALVQAKLWGDIICLHYRTAFGSSTSGTLSCAWQWHNSAWASLQKVQAQPEYYNFQPCCVGKTCPRDLVCRPTEEFQGHGSYARPTWTQDASNELLCYFCEAREGATCGPQTDNNVKCCADLKSFGPGFPQRVMHCSAPDGSATEGNTTCAECGYDDKV